MSDYVIKVEKLGKSYQIRHQRERYTALRDVLAEGAKNAARGLLRRPPAAPDATREEFWALQDVSFEVKQGERLGIIGRNGAGKSTLLKILSRITEPTRGEVRLRGRVASLLEVGTGFHPELTGRENIYLNGAILGMTRAEIRRKFDEIVAFAEVEKFLDTPVKRYSSGMYVRLAFAVAAHLEPEILLVDEVLAVGDAEFQKKCLGKMSEVAQEGRTVLFVSHNMGAVESLCERCLLLGSGRLLIEGEVTTVVRSYLSIGTTKPVVLLANRTDRIGDGSMRVEDVWLTTLMSNQRTESVMLGDAVFFKIVVKSCCEFRRAYVNLQIFDDLQRLVFAFHAESGFRPNIVPGENTFTLEIPFLHLMPGNYSVAVQLLKPDTQITDRVEGAFSFNVLQRDLYGSGMSFHRGHGYTFIPHRWTQLINNQLVSTAWPEGYKAQV